MFKVSNKAREEYKRNFSKVSKCLIFCLYCKPEINFTRYVTGFLFVLAHIDSELNMYEKPLLMFL